MSPRLCSHVRNGVQGVQRESVEMVAEVREREKRRKKEEKKEKSIVERIKTNKRTVMQGLMKGNDFNVQRFVLVLLSLTQISRKLVTISRPKQRKEARETD